MGEYHDVRMWFQLARARERARKLEAWLVVDTTVMIGQAVIIAVLATRS